MFDDLRTALRSLRASPTFTGVALTVLALGIGAGTAIFSVVDAVVLRGLPFDEHDRLVAVLEYDTRRPETFGAGRTTPQTYLDWRRLQESFEALAGVGSEGVLSMRSETGEPTDLQALRIPLIRGRYLSSQDTEHSQKVVVINEAAARKYWEGADPLGQPITINKQEVTVVGIVGDIRHLGPETPPRRKPTCRSRRTACTA
jgi:hypothetical protein